LLFLILFGCVPTLHGAAWQDTRSWNDAEETAYSNWVQRLGKKSWKSVHLMLHDRSVNSYYTESDKHLSFRSDCGDLPFVLRSYFAYKRQLPIIIPVVRGGNYSPTPNPTVALISNRSYPGDIRDFFLRLPNIVNTATLRSDYRQNNTACYPTAINRQALRPGTLFYDPNGHAAIVCDIEADGTIRFIDAHPDQSVTRSVFGPKFHWKTSSLNGGFMFFRPIYLRRGVPEFENDARRLPHRSTEQYQLGNDYHMQIKLRLAQSRLDPVSDLERYIKNDTYREALDRVEAVKRGWSIARHTPIHVPPNIYYSDGPWENLSTPGRDIRLRLSFLNIPSRIQYYLRLSQQSPELVVKNARAPIALLDQLIKTQERLFKTLTIDYPNSRGQLITLSLLDIERRLFLLSFDPNHPPELRWGAEGRELATAPRNRSRYYLGYLEERPWRYRLTKKPGPMFPADRDNPKHPPRHDITNIVKQLKKP